MPLPIVLRRVYYDAIARGEKTIEYRLHRPPFTANSLWPGRRPTFMLGRDGRTKLPARVTKFEISTLGQLDGDLAAHETIAIIHFTLE